MSIPDSISNEEDTINFSRRLKTADIVSARRFKSNGKTNSQSPMHNEKIKVDNQEQKIGEFDKIIKEVELKKSNIQNSDYQDIDLKIKQVMRQNNNGVDRKNEK